MKRHSLRRRLSHALTIVVIISATVILGTAVPASADGPYELISYATGECADVYLGSLDNGASVVMEPCEHYSEQLWSTHWTANPGTFAFQNYRSDKCLDIPRYLYAGQAVQNGCGSATATQQWRYSPSQDATALPTPGNHVYQLYNVRSGLCLQNNGNLVQITCNGQYDQMWIVAY